MVQTLFRLNPKTVASIKEPGRHSDGGNLYLSVSPSGAKSWVFFYRFRGRVREMGLGPLISVTLASAREKAAAARALVADGIDPLEQRQRERDRPEIPTFGAVAEAYIEVNTPGWSNPKHPEQWRSTLKTHAAALWTKRVDQIDVGDVYAVLSPIWTKIPETARRLRGRIEKVLASAKVQNFRTGENPARWQENMDHLLPKVSKSAGHFAAMTFDKVPAFLADLRPQASIGARALEFGILNANRTIEVASAQWDEIDWTARIWTVPAERMKGKVKHSIPLSSRAMAILEEMRGKDPKFIFPGARPNKPIVTATISAVLKRMGIEDATAHGFRSSFKDWAAEKTNFENIVSEMALAHKIPSQVEAAYRRGDLMEKRRRLMEAWCGYCMRPPASAGDVVAFGRMAS